VGGKFVPPPGQAPRPRPDGRLVLVVEDEVLIAMDLEQLLHRHGWRVLGPAATVAEALRLLASDRPDVALLDVDLRGEPVTPVAEEPRARGVPFVPASAHDGHELGVVALARRRPSVGERRLLAALARAVAP
jgi:two-component system, response regulator PdtaR